MTDDEKLLDQRLIAGARAVGVLTWLLKFDQVPPAHLKHVREIVAQWDKTEDKQEAA